VKKLSEVFEETLKDKEIIGLLKKTTGYKVENLGSEEAARYLEEENKGCQRL
jgi:hypothetical protein